MFSFQSLCVLAAVPQCVGSGDAPLVDLRYQNPLCQYRGHQRQSSGVLRRLCKPHPSIPYHCGPSYHPSLRTSTTWPRTKRLYRSRRSCTSWQLTVMPETMPSSLTPSPAETQHSSESTRCFPEPYTYTNIGHLCLQSYRLGSCKMCALSLPHLCSKFLASFPGPLPCVAWVQRSNAILAHCRGRAWGRG